MSHLGYPQGGGSELSAPGISSTAPHYSAATSGRHGASKAAHKQAPAAGPTKTVADIGKVPINSIHIVIREARGLNFCFGGEHVPEFRPAGGG